MLLGIAITIHSAIMYLESQRKDGTKKVKYPKTIHTYRVYEISERYGKGKMVKEFKVRNAAVKFASKSIYRWIIDFKGELYFRDNRSALYNVTPIVVSF